MFSDVACRKAMGRLTVKDRLDLNLKRRKHIRRRKRPGSDFDKDGNLCFR